MPRRILSKTKSKIQKAERRGKSKNKVFQDLARPRRILSKTKSKIEAERRDKYFNIWLGRGGYPFSYTVTVNH